MIAGLRLREGHKPETYNPTEMKTNEKQRTRKEGYSKPIRQYSR